MVAAALLVETSKLLRSAEEQAVGRIGEGGVERRGEFLRDLGGSALSTKQRNSSKAAMAKGTPAELWHSLL